MLKTREKKKDTINKYSEKTINNKKKNLLCKYTRICCREGETASGRKNQFNKLSSRDYFMGCLIYVHIIRNSRNTINISKNNCLVLFDYLYTTPTLNGFGLSIERCYHN